MNSNVGLMTIIVGFKIRKKSDTMVFVEKCMNKNQEYILKIDDEFAIIFVKNKNGSVSVMEKHYDLYNPFNPTIEVACTNNDSYKETVYDYVWKYRKYINAEWFSN